MAKNTSSQKKAMSQFCPLCGKTKPEEALFCDDCAKKIRTDYEVTVPEKAASENTFAHEDSSANEDLSTKGKLDNSFTEPKKKKRIVAPLLLILLAALLMGAFFVYNTTIRRDNLDRSGWDLAVRTNSTEGYLAYMEAHPKGAHFDEAQAGLRRLKSEDASTWERMKESDNTTELRDFLDRHSNSPYAPLVRSRLDSLMWIGTLQTNTPESYADYIALAEEGRLRGDYIAIARKRHDLLSRTQTADAVTLDSIRAAVDGFFIALSALDHNDMVRYLAPTVYRFFNSGAATRERITGELLVTGAQTEGGTLKFTPDLESVQHEVTSSHHYKVNVPLRKSYRKDGATDEVYGYIAHIELDTLFQIVSIFETKPYPEAP